jgi:two-component system, OmpR family, sensor histidine kinase KdpD
VEVVLPANLPLVEFDATLIERVLFNLLENAGKYTPEGTAVRIGAEPAGNELVVSVTDGGPGVPASQREAIFEKFTRGSRESATPGVGLGLAISRAIVEAHHGRIWVDDAPNGGARFAFTLPLGTPPDVPETEESLGGSA